VGQHTLHDAASQGDGKIVEILLLHGANPNIKNKDGKTPAEMTNDSGLKLLLQQQHRQIRQNQNHPSLFDFEVLGVKPPDASVEEITRNFEAIKTSYERILAFKKNIEIDLLRCARVVSLHTAVDHGHDKMV
jgi:ankyrin repeat protein